MKLDDKQLAIFCLLFLGLAALWAGGTESLDLIRDIVIAVGSFVTGVIMSG